MKRLLLALGLVCFLGCNAEIIPIPVPSVLPSPTPMPNPPPPPPEVMPPTILKVVGNKFHTKGKEVFLLGEAGCCQDPRWPWLRNRWTSQSWVRSSWLDELGKFGGNWTHIRLGPFSAQLEERPEMRGYLDNGEFNPEFFGNLNLFLDQAYSVGVYVEIDLIDAWAAKKRLLDWPDTDCDLVKHAPQEVHKRWLKKVVLEIGYHENILWQISNESFVCGSTPDWELGVVKVVREQEKKSGYLKHPISTNAQDKKIEKAPEIDYINTHQESAPEQPNYTEKPVQTNEYNPGIGAEGLRREVERAISRGTWFQYWVSDDTEHERHKALQVIKEFREAWNESVGKNQVDPGSTNGSAE